MSALTFPTACSSLRVLKQNDAALKPLDLDRNGQLSVDELVVALDRNPLAARHINVLVDWKLYHVARAEAEVCACEAELPTQPGTGAYVVNALKWIFVRIPFFLVAVVVYPRTIGPFKDDAVDRYRAASSNVAIARRELQETEGREGGSRAQLEKQITAAWVQIAK